MSAVISQREPYWEKFVRPAAGKPDLLAISSQHGMLAFILCLFSFDFAMLLATHNPVSALTNLGVAAMLLANHLAFGFRWSRRSTVFLRSMSLGVTAVVAIGLCFALALAR